MQRSNDSRQSDDEQSNGQEGMSVQVKPTELLRVMASTARRGRPHDGRLWQDLSTLWTISTLRPTACFSVRRGFE